MKTVELLSEDERREFDFDTRKIDWNIAGAIFTYGIGKYYLNQNLISPVSDL